jgi:hypothetical protein
MGGNRMGSGGMGHEGNGTESESNGQSAYERAMMSQKSELKQRFALATPQR